MCIVTVRGPLKPCTDDKLLIFFSTTRINPKGRAQRSFCLDAIRRFHLLVINVAFIGRSVFSPFNILSVNGNKMMSPPHTHTPTLPAKINKL